MLFSKTRFLSASTAALAMFASFAALSSACTSPTGPDLALSEVAGNYGPVVLGDNISLTAVFSSNLIDTHRTDNNGNEIWTNTTGGNVQASLLSSLNPLVGQVWNSASISVNATDLVLTQNPSDPTPTVYSIAQSQITAGDSSPITYFSSQTQLGQTVSDAVSSGCEALTTEYLALDTYSDHFEANLIERTQFNDISPVGGAPDVTCAQLFAQIQADIRSGTTNSQNQLFAVFVTNGVISVDQIAQLQELDVSAGLSAVKIADAPTTTAAANAIMATGPRSVASASLKSVHAAVVSAVRR